MKTTLLLILLIFSAFAFSQEYPDSNSYCNLVPYYDYELCSKGLKDDSGRVLLEPRFSEITLLPNDLILVCENDQYGVIDCSFNTIIPIKYKKLTWQSKYFYVPRCGPNYYWFFETDTGVGLMNSSLEVIFHPEHDRIERVHVEAQARSRNHMYYNSGVSYATAAFFRVTTNGKSAIYNELGEIIVPNHFDEIHCYGVRIPASTPKLPHGIFFIAKNDSNQVILSEKGEQLIKESLDVALHVFSVDSSTVVTTTKPDHTVQAICLETGSTIEESKNKIYKDQLFLIRPSGDNTSFDVFGKKLEPIFTVEGWCLGAQLLSINSAEFLALIYGDRKTAYFSREGEVLIQTDDLFYNVQNDSGDYLWTVPKDLSEKEDTMRIYFPSGELKHEYVISGIGSTHFFQKRWSSSYDEKLDGILFIKKGSKWGALDRNGELKIPFQFDTCGIPYGSKYLKLGRLEEKMVFGYYLSKKGKMGSIDRYGNKLFACKYDTTFSAEIDLSNYEYFNSHKYPEYFLWEKKAYSSFAIRKNRLVTIHEGKERVCDSTFLPFEGPLLLVGHVLVDYNGKVVREIKTGEIHKTKKFIFHIQGNQAQVILTNGENGLKVENFKSAQVEGDYLKVKLTDETVGLISLDGLRWLYEPKYYDITFTKVNSPEYAWVKEDTLQTYLNYTLKILENYDGRWMLVDTSYNQLYDFPFKTPVNLVYAPSAVFESENRYGLIDSSLNVVFPPEYELIYPIRYSEYVLLYKDRSWQLGHSSGALLPQQFTSISYQEVNGAMAVFSHNESDTLIGFVKFENNNLKWALPMTEMNKLISKESLHAALYDKENPVYTIAGIEPKLDSLDVWRVQNNELILSYALQNQCHIRMLGLTHPTFIPDFEFNNPQTHIPSKQFYDEVNTRSFGNHSRYIKSEFTYPPELKETQKVTYYSVCRWHVFLNDEILSIAVSPNCLSRDYERTYDNYVYMDSVRLIELNDLLKQDKETSAFLRNFIVERLTIVQSGVEVCPDLDKSEEFMWSNFHFTQGGIQFPDSGLQLTYSELEPYLTDFGKALNPW